MTENGADYTGAVSPPAKATNGPPWLLQGNPEIAKKHPQMDQWPELRGCNTRQTHHEQGTKSAFIDWQDHPAVDDPGL